MKRSAGRTFCIRIISVLLLCAAVLLLIAAKAVHGFAQWYSINIYSLITGSLGRLAGSVTFSIAETLVMILPVLIVIDIIRCRKRISAALSHILLLASFLFFLYAANCGVNYYRDSFVDQQSLSEAAFTEEQLVEFCEYLISRIDACGPDTDYPQGKALSETAQASMHELSRSYTSLQGYYPAPKSLTVLSGAFSDMGISGIYSPFTVEANINGQMPDMEKPFTACHELSHLRGYMNEGEANYIGWLACINSDDLSFRRSGWLIGWIYAGSVLRRIDPDMYARLYETLPEHAVTEIENNELFWAAHEGKSSVIQDKVNDAYLKANGQEEGIQSYSMLTTLMMMYYFDQ